MFYLQKDSSFNFEEEVYVKNKIIRKPVSLQLWFSN